MNSRRGQDKTCAALQGVEARMRQVVWNRSDNRVKLICLCRKATPVGADMPASLPTGTAVTNGGAGDSGAAFKSYSDSVKAAT